MSFRLQALVWEVSIPLTAKFVLLRLAHHAHDDGTSVYPTIATVAQACGCGERTVQETLRELESAGVLVFVQEADFGAKRGREYRIDVEALQAISTGAPYAPVRSLHRCAKQRRRVRHLHPTGAPSAPKPIIEPISKPISAGGGLGKTATSLFPEVSVKDQFETFWRIFPKRAPHSNPKKPALQKFEAAVRRGIPVADIIAGAERFAAYCGEHISPSKPQSIPQALTWLSQERWTDAHEEPVGQSYSGGMN